jgi:hypothetical protein
MTELGTGSFRTLLRSDAIPNECVAPTTWATAEHESRSHGSATLSLRSGTRACERKTGVFHGCDRAA